MAIMSSVLIFVIFIPLILVGLGVLVYRCAKSKNIWGLIIPLIVACFALLLGWISLIGAGLLVAVYFITRYNEKLKAEKKNEIDRMNKMDL